MNTEDFLKGWGTHLSDAELTQIKVLKETFPYFELEAFEMQTIHAQEKYKAIFAFRGSLSKGTIEFIFS